MKRVDVETLRALLSDDKVSVAVAKIVKVELLEDFSECRALVSVFPEEYEAVVRVAFPHANAGGGWFALPQANDLVVVGFPTKDDGLLLGYLSSKEDLIPKQAKEGHSILLARPGKNLELASATKGLLGKGLPDAPPDEPLVLGNVLKTMLTTFIEKHTTHLTKLEAILDQLIAGDIFLVTSPGNPTGPNPAKTTALNQLKTDVGTVKDDLATLKTDFLETADTNIVSQLWFTERGGAE